MESHSIDETRWYVWVDDKTYGPYTCENLLEFLTPDMFTCPENGTEWLKASEIPELKYILEQSGQEPRGWYIKSFGGPENGPYTRKEMDNLIASGKIGENDYFKHIDWADYKHGTQTGIFSPHKNKTKSVSEPPSIDKFIEELIISSDEELKKEFHEHWHRYPKNFQRALLSELKKRKLVSFFDRLNKIFA